jgi:hypothetical protein
MDQPDKPSDQTSLYVINAVPPVAIAGGQDPYPPGTIHTASVETVDNDRVHTMVLLGVVR